MRQRWGTGVHVGYWRATRHGILNAVLSPGGAFHMTKPCAETARAILGKAAKAAGSTTLFLIFLLVLDLLLTNLVGWEFVASRTGKERLSRTYSPVYHHGLAANRTISDARWGFLSYGFSTNSLGFKDRAVREVPLAVDRHRVLLIGDSFMEGMGYPFDETAAGRIATGLEEEGIDVLNAGVGSYAPSVYFSRARHLYETAGLKYDELVVFIDISDIPNEALNYRLDEHGHVVPEDVRGVPLFTFQARGQVLNFLKNHSMTFMILTHFNRLRKARRKELDPCIKARMEAGQEPREPALLARIRERLMNNTLAMWSFDEKVYDDVGKRGLEESGDSMTRLSKFVRERNIPLTVVVYPWPQQIFFHDLESRQVSYWKDWAARNEAGFINLFPDFVTDRAPMDTYLDYFIVCDEHWNDRGHAYVADLFLERFTPSVTGTVLREG